MDLSEKKELKKILIKLKAKFLLHLNHNHFIASDEKGTIDGIVKKTLFPRLYHTLSVNAAHLFTTFVKARR